jgi:hypothetical protein
LGFLTVEWISDLFSRFSRGRHGCSCENSNEAPPACAGEETVD